MSDVFSKAKRSALMARIRSAGNASTERRLAKLMRKAHIRGWRRGARLRLPAPGSRLQRVAIARAEVAGGRQRSRRSVESVFSPSVTRCSGLGNRHFSVLRASALAPRPIVVRPDFVFRRARLVVFVDGCFFHGCPWHATWPRQNAAFWRAKIEGNIARDRRVDRALRAAGWRVLHVWEHALAPRAAAHTCARLRAALAR